MELHDFKQRGMVVMDGRRTLAVCRPAGPSGAGLWLCTAKGFSWADPAARRPNSLGIVNPAMWLIKGKAQARKVLKELAQK